jgi:hypothetical protein
MMKQEKDTAWMRAYKDVAKTFSDFMVSNRDTLSWTGTKDAGESFTANSGKSLESFKGGNKPAGANAGGNLFGEIQSNALNFQSNLKHIEKNAHKKNLAEGQ